MKQIATFKNLNYYNALRNLNDAIVWAKAHKIEVKADELIPVVAKQFKCSANLLSDYFYGFKTLEV